MQQLRAFRRRMQPHHAAIVVIVFAADETVALHAEDQSRDGRRTDLLGPGERSDRGRPAEDQDRQGRGARRRQAHRIVLPAEAPEQVDGGGMEAVGDGIDVR